MKVVPQHFLVGEPHPIEWEDWIDETYPGLRDELRTDALTYKKVDWQQQAAYWESQV